MCVCVSVFSGTLQLLVPPCEKEGLMPLGCMCVCEVYLPTVHFGREQISQNPPAAVELVEIVPHSSVIQLRKFQQSNRGRV